MIKNTRGLELAIGSVAIIAVVLLVIIVVVGFFLGGFGRAGGGIAEIGAAGEEGATGLNLGFKCIATPSGDKDTCSAINNSEDCNREKHCYWAYVSKPEEEQSTP